jgi:hypothetical protein
MRRLRVSIAIGVVLSLLSMGTAYAYNITNASYTGTVQITNSAAAAAYNQTANFTLNTTSLINAGFLNSSVSNVALAYNGQDVPYMPGASGNQSWFAFISSIGALSNPTYTLYMGGNQTMNSTQVYFPGADGMATTDNASLELGSNFTITQTGFIDTSAGANKWLVNKTGAFTTNISGVGSITSSINLLPTSAQNNGGGAISWSSPNNSVDNSTVTYAEVSLTATGSKLLEVDGGLELTNTIYYFADVQNAAVFIDTLDVYYSGSWHSVLGSANGTGAWWSAVPIGGNYSVSAIRISFTNPSGLTYWARVYELRFTRYDSIQATASGISSGVHTVTTTADSTNLSIYVDSVLKQTLSLNGSSVVDNTNNWTFCTSNATPYLTRQQIWVGGNLRQDISWQYKTTWPILFSDASGNGNTATPTFPIGGSSATVTANITSFSPITQTTSDLTNPGVTSSNITQAFVAPPGLYTELNIQAPGANLTNSLLDGANIPRAIFWFPFLFGIIGLLGFATAWLTRSLLIQGLVMAFTMILFSLMGGFGYWVCIEFIIMASAIIVGGKQYGF